MSASFWTREHMPHIESAARNSTCIIRHFQTNSPAHVTMNIFLTGASGLVGSAFARAASRRGHHVVGVVGAFAGRLPGVASQFALDLAQPEAVTRSVLETFPDIIVNC